MIDSRFCIISFDIVQTLAMARLPW